MAKRINGRHVAKKNRAPLATASFFASTGLITGYLPYVQRATAAAVVQSTFDDLGDCNFDIKLSGSSVAPIGDVQTKISSELKNALFIDKNQTSAKCSTVTINFSHMYSETGVIEMDTQLSLYTYSGDVILDFKNGLELDGDGIYGISIFSGIGSENQVSVNNLVLDNSSGLNIDSSKANVKNSMFTGINGTSITSFTLDDLAISNTIFGEKGTLVPNRTGQGVYLRNDNSKLAIENSKFYGNVSSQGGGGAVYLSGYSSTMKVKDSIFDSNYSYGGGGGAIYVNGYSYPPVGSDASVQIENSKFIGNAANENLGGAIATFGAFVQIRKSEFANNYANGSGGAIFAYGSSFVQIRESKFANNYANGSGGAIFTDDSGSHEIVNNSFWGNSSATGASSIQSNLYFQLDPNPIFREFSIIHNTFDNSSLENPSVAISQNSPFDSSNATFEGMHVIGNIFNHPLNRSGEYLPRQLDIRLTGSLNFQTSIMYNTSSGRENPLIWSKDRGPDGEISNLDNVPNLFKGNLAIEENLIPSTGSEAQSFVKWSNLSSADRTLLFPGSDKLGRARSSTAADAGAFSIFSAGGGGGGGFAGPITTELTSKVLPSFEPGSYKLNRKVRNSLKRLMLANLDARTVTCEVLVSKNFTKDQRKLARAQARAVCVLIEKRYPWAKAEEIKLTFVKRSDPNVGRARITLG
jgi:hypothetical protein